MYWPYMLIHVKHRTVVDKVQLQEGYVFKRLQKWVCIY